MIEETITLVPNVVYVKAKELSKLGLYDSALEILEQNKIECKVYSENVDKKRQRESRFDRKIPENNRGERTRKISSSF